MCVLEHSLKPSYVHHVIANMNEFIPTVLNCTLTKIRVQSDKGETHNDEPRRHLLGKELKLMARPISSSFPWQARHSCYHSFKLALRCITFPTACGEFGKRSLSCHGNGKWSNGRDHEPGASGDEREARRVPKTGVDMDGV